MKRSKEEKLWEVDEELFQMYAPLETFLYSKEKENQKFFYLRPWGRVTPPKQGTQN
jgi:hypothetical protein